MRLQSHCLTVVSLSPNIQPALTELVSGSMRTEQFEAGSPSGHVSLYTLSFELFCTKFQEEQVKLETSATGTPIPLRTTITRKITVQSETMANTSPA